MSDKIVEETCISLFVVSLNTTSLLPVSKWHHLWDKQKAVCTVGFNLLYTEKHATVLVCVHVSLRLSLFGPRSQSQKLVY